VEPIVALTGVTKRFGAVTALKDMSFDLFEGEVHVLLGENGAGKSTLVNTLIGSFGPDEGTLAIRGEIVRRHSPANARRAGINVVLQDFSLAPTLSVAENLFLGREPLRAGLVDRAAIIRRATELLESLGGTLDPRAEVGTLPRAEQQLVEITKSFVGVPGVLLLDEPTAAISESEANRLFAIVDRLRGEGWAILYITHRMEEVRRLGDRVTVMRDGMKISTYAVSEVTDQKLVADMVGRDIAGIYPAKSTGAGEKVLVLGSVSSADGRVADIDLTVRSGEIVGIAGLVGSGKSELARLILGLSDTWSGTYTVAGTTVTRPNPRRMIELGIGFMPEDRRREALALQRSVEENITLEVVGTRVFSPFGFLRRRALREVAVELMDRTDVRPRTHATEVGSLSGGNQQKVVLARALTQNRSVFVVAEPTAGVDVGARQQIYAQLRRLCEEGAGVLAISSDLEEIVGIADRIYVMNGGRIHVELVGSAITHEAVVAGAFGHATAS
jgi:ribose transport system ATP-binding protein